MQHNASASVPSTGRPITKNQNNVELESNTVTPLPSSLSSLASAAAAAVAPEPFVVVVVGCDQPFSVVVVVAYTVEPPGVQVSMHFAPLDPHAGGTGHSVVVSEAFHEMCQGA